MWYIAMRCCTPVKVGATGGGIPPPNTLGQVEVLEVVLQHVEHDAAYQVHTGRLVLPHLGYQTVERGSNGPDGIADCDGYR